MKTVLSLLLSCFCLCACAQDNMKTEMFPEMSRGAGISFQKFDGLNNRIANFPQYKQIRDATGVLQLGWFKENHQFISQINLMAGSSMSGDRDTRSSTIRYLGAGVDIGYDFIKSDKVALYPLVGLGYQAYQARFFRDNSGVDFNTVLSSTTVQNSIKSLDLTNGFFNYRLGAGIAATSAKHHASIGIQALYTGGFQDRAWRSSQDQTLSNAPVDKLSQVYVGLVLTCSPFFMMKHNRM
jgi:Outer membrane protein beta-barrel domain